MSDVIRTATTATWMSQRICRRYVPRAIGERPTESGWNVQLVDMHQSARMV